MRDIKILQEKRAEAVKGILALRETLTDDKPDFTAEEQERWTKLNADCDAFASRIEVEKRAADLSKQLGSVPSNGPGRSDVSHEPKTGKAKPKVHEEHRALSLQAWILRQAGKPLRQEHRDACKRTGVHPGARDFDFKLLPTAEMRSLRNVERRDNITTLGTAGGYTVPMGFVQRIEQALLQFGSVRKVAEILRTDSGNDLPWPTMNDTGNEGHIVGETQLITPTDLVFGAVVFHAYKWTSDFVRVSYELMEDSAFDLAAMMGDWLGERIARGQNRAFTTGDGAEKPTGITVAASVGITAASPTSIAADELFKLFHSVDPAYRGNFKWMMHDQILAVLRLLKDSVGQYLWVQGLAQGVPDRLLGYPVEINQHMAPAIVSGATTIVGGDLSKYKIRDCRGIRLRRLDERFADQDETAFVAFLRSDGNLLDAGTHPVRTLKQP